MLNPIEKTHMKIIALQGPPASGKSTLARQLQAQDPDHIVIVSRDSFRHGRGQYWIPSQEDYITELEQHAIRTALDMGYDVIIDATNLSEHYVNRWKFLASIYDADIEFRMVDATLEECLERNKNANREHQVDEDCIRRFYQKYLIYKQNHK